MNNKTPHLTYILLLVASLLISGSTFFIKDISWNTIVASIGAGGVASVCVAWLLDARNTKIREMEGKRKTEAIMNRFVRIFRHMMWEVANECYGIREKDETHSFKDWLSCLNVCAPLFPQEGQNTMKRRCTRISGSITQLQQQIEYFQSQSATLVFEDFPSIEKALNDLEVLWTHCLGTLHQLEIENYEHFCYTAYILYTDFINAFPQYKDRFPEEYSLESFSP